eukprot:scaffold1771_cov384-Prasinococcus_capsulatus_cf.AAC.7
MLLSGSLRGSSVGRGRPRRIGELWQCKKNCLPGDESATDRMQAQLNFHSSTSSYGTAAGPGISL